MREHSQTTEICSLWTELTTRSWSFRRHPELERRSGLQSKLWIERVSTSSRRTQLGPERASGNALVGRWSDPSRNRCTRRSDLRLLLSAPSSTVLRGAGTLAGECCAEKRTPTEEDTSVPNDASSRSTSRDERDSLAWNTLVLRSHGGQHD